MCELIELRTVKQNRIGKDISIFHTHCKSEKKNSLGLHLIVIMLFKLINVLFNNMSRSSDRAQDDPVKLMVVFVQLSKQKVKKFTVIY